jgi:hypothetical protein
MRKISKKFEDIWSLAEARNRAEGRHRFHQINSLNRKYITLGIYDSVTKKYCLFDTINLVGNFRYNHRDVPAEFQEMEDMIRG